MSFKQQKQKKFALRSDGSLRNSIVALGCFEKCDVTLSQDSTQFDTIFGVIVNWKFAHLPGILMELG